MPFVGGPSRPFLTERTAEVTWSPDGERLVWNGTVRLAPLASRGVFEVADLKARTVWNYLRDSLPFEIAAGTIGLKGDYEFAGAPGPMSLAVNVHNTTVTGLGVRPKGGTGNYIDVARIAVEETRCDLMKPSRSRRSGLLFGPLPR